MSISDIEMLFKFFGGLGMFLYGMNVMADGLQKSAGNKMKQLMGFLTNNRLVAILVGAAVTAIIQSSSATTVMVVGFVNAGIVNLTQAVGVIMGANIGTTVTAWIVSMSEWGSMLKPEFFAPVLIGIGAIVMLFAKSQRKKDLGAIGVGFGVLFIGLSFMSDSITPYRDAPIFAKAFEVLGQNPFLGILTGAVVTGIIQSSSASVGILQTLALNGVVNWNSAIFITLGQNIGTCVTALISSAGAQRTAKRAAVIHLLFNTIGAIAFGIIMYVVFFFNKEFAGSTINSVQISIFHTIFNISNTLILLPFANQLVTLSGKIVREKAEDREDDETEEEEAVRHLDERILESPAFAVESAVTEVVHMGKVTLKNMQRACDAITNNDNKKIKRVYKTEETINMMEKVLTEYLVKINNLSLTEDQQAVVNDLFYTISDIERIGDHVENIAEFQEYRQENGVEFSERAVEDLKQLMELAYKSFEHAVIAREEESIRHASKSAEYEDEVDNLEEELRELHIDRLSKGKCTAESGVVFLDILNNLERISDHAYNMAGYIMAEQ